MKPLIAVSRNEFRVFFLLPFGAYRTILLNRIINQNVKEMSEWEAWQMGDKSENY